MLPSKAISLLQPWAWLVAAGHKQIETRSWYTAHRGELAIHASGGRRGDIRRLCEQDPFIRAVLAEAGLRYDTLPRGGIVGACGVVGVEQMVEQAGVATFDLRDSRRLGERERAFGEYAPGRFAWLLQDARALPDLIPCPGRLQLWTMAASVREQLGQALSLTSLSR